MEAFCSHGLVTWKGQWPKDCLHQWRGQDALSLRMLQLFISDSLISSLYRILLCLLPVSFKRCHRMTSSGNKQKNKRKKERGRKCLCQSSENQGNVTVLGPPGCVTYRQIQLQKKPQTTTPWGPGSDPPGRASPVASQPGQPSPFLHALLWSMDFCIFIPFSLESAVHMQGLLW